MRVSTNTIYSFTAIIFSLLLGFSVWWLSPTFTHHVEPWDAAFPFYWMTLFIGGALIAIISRQNILVCAFGVWIGQIVALSFLPGLDRSWIVLGVITVASGATISGFGGWAATLITNRFKKHARK